MSPLIGWDENSPPESASAGLGDDNIRSLKTSVRAGLDGEHVWPSAGGDAGVHRLGSARAYVGTQSQVSSAGTDGRLMWASDTSQLYHVGSGGTSLVGGSRVMSVGTTAGFTYPQRHQWVEEFGIVHMPAASGTSVSVTFPNSGYSGIPYVWLTQNETSSAAAVSLTNWGAIGITPTSFIIYATGGSSDFTVAWMSKGTRVL